MQDRARFSLPLAGRGRGGGRRVKAPRSSKKLEGWYSSPTSLEWERVAAQQPGEGRPSPRKARPVVSGNVGALLKNRPALTPAPLPHGRGGRVALLRSPGLTPSRSCPALCRASRSGIAPRLLSRRALRFFHRDHRHKAGDDEQGHDQGRAHARPVGLHRPCSHFVLDSSSKLGYILVQSCSPRGALARRRRLREQNTVSCRGSHPLPREAQAARRACPQPQAGLTAVTPA